MAREVLGRVLPLTVWIVRRTMDDARSCLRRARRVLDGMERFDDSCAFMTLVPWSSSVEMLCRTWLDPRRLCQRGCFRTGAGRP